MSPFHVAVLSRCKAEPLVDPSTPHGPVIKVVEKIYRSSVNLSVADRCEC